MSLRRYCYADHRMILLEVISKDHFFILGELAWRRALQIKPDLGELIT